MFVEAIVNEIYYDLRLQDGNIKYLRYRAILTPRNEHVEHVNLAFVERLEGEVKVYHSCGSVCKGFSNSDADEVLYPAEYLNAFKFSGIPNHEVHVKFGAPIMLLRNINAKKGLCNGTRTIVTRCYPFQIEVLIITGNRFRETTYIPRINMRPDKKIFPFVLKRKQFPIDVCHAMTINKSLGQMVQNVELFLPDPVFCHG